MLILSNIFVDKLKIVVYHSVVEQINICVLRHLMSLLRCLCTRLVRGRLSTAQVGVNRQKVSITLLSNLCHLCQKLHERSFFNEDSKTNYL